jgi:hypothetical protein
VFLGDEIKFYGGSEIRFRVSKMVFLGTSKKAFGG